MFEFFLALGEYGHWRPSWGLSGTPCQNLFKQG